MEKRTGRVVAARIERRFDHPYRRESLRRSHRLVCLATTLTVVMLSSLLRSTTNAFVARAPSSAAFCRRCPLDDLGRRRRRRLLHRNVRETLFLASNNNDDDSYDRTVSDEWNLVGVRKETERLVSRCHKKIGKAKTRYDNALKTVEKLTSDDYDATMEELEACPNVDALADDLAALRERLTKLTAVEDGLSNLKGKGKTAVLPLDVAEILVELRVNDAPPARKPQVKRRKQSNGDARQQEGPRRPYRRYYAIDGTEIRVGKQATDNDELSCNAEHRDADDWWMHASGCPGSHVVIRTTERSTETLADAAALAAVRSKCRGDTVKVTLTKCRHVTKPPGAKAGLVQIRGDVSTMTVKRKDAEKRLARLEETVLV